MTATTLTALTEWGVRHHGHLAAVVAVDACADEAYARWWCGALLFCGNHDAVLVTRPAGTDDPWTPTGGA